jgi:hypothetical protein
MRALISCICAMVLLSTPAFADTFSSMRELSSYATNIKNSAERGDMKTAERYAVAGLQLTSKNPRGYERSFVNLYIVMPTKDLISSFRRLGKYDRADYLTTWLYDTQSKIYGVNSIETVEAISQFASTLEAQHKYGEAEGRYKQALAISSKAPFIDTVGKITVMGIVMNYAAMLKKLGRDKDAQACLDTMSKYQ